MALLEREKQSVSDLCGRLLRCVTQWWRCLVKGFGEVGAVVAGLCL